MYKFEASELWVLWRRTEHEAEGWVFAERPLWEEKHSLSFLRSPGVEWVDWRVCGWWWCLKEMEINWGKWQKSEDYRSRNMKKKRQRSKSQVSGQEPEMGRSRSKSGWPWHYYCGNWREGQGYLIIYFSPTSHSKLPTWVATMEVMELAMSVESTHIYGGAWRTPSLTLYSSPGGCNLTHRLSLEVRLEVAYSKITKGTKGTKTSGHQKPRTNYRVAEAPLRTSIMDIARCIIHVPLKNKIIDGTDHWVL